MIKRIITFLGFLVLCSTLSSESEFEKLAKKFAPPKEIQETIEQNKDKLQKGQQLGNVFYKGFAYYTEHVDFCKKNDQPLCWHVAGISRIINAYRMKRLIDRYGLNLLAVPKKYIYFLNDHWRVFTEYIEPDKLAEKKLSDEQLKQMATFVEETGYEDFGCPLKGPTGNFGRNIISKDGKLFFIDTEDLSFMDVRLGKTVSPFWIDWNMLCPRVSTYIKGPTIARSCRAQYLENLYKHLYVNKKFIGSEQLKAWLKNRLDYLWHNSEGLMHKDPIHTTTQFDDAGINFKKARQELKNIEYFSQQKRYFDIDCVGKDASSVQYPGTCKEYVDSMIAIDKKLQEKYGAQPRTDMQDPKLQEAAAYWQSVNIDK